MNKLFLKIENKKIIQLDCPICKKLFYIENWRLKNTKSPCCSKKCSVILKQSFRIKCNCDFCNKNLNIILSKFYNKSGKHFCNSICQKSFYKIIGNSPKFGIKDIKSSIRMILDNPSKRPEIKEKLSKIHIQRYKNGAISPRLGIKETIEHRLKLSKAHGGNGITFSNRGNYSGLFNNDLKFKIRQRDNFECQCCGLKESKHFRNLKNINLIIHHINYNKQDCNDINLITLCNACNIKANYNRNNWEVLYNNKINEIYGVCNEKI